MLKKENAIQEILNDFKECSDLVMQQLDILESIVQGGKANIADETLKSLMNNEKKMDKYEVKISEKVINTIVLYHPMASELRKIISCHRMIVSLERIGDLITNIVNFINNLEDKELFIEMSDVLYNMVLSSKSMVQKALLSFVNQDKEFAIWTIKNDDVIDEMNIKLINKSIKKSKIPEEIRPKLMSLINFKSIVYNIERIGNHAAHIAETSIYSLEGKDVRHKDIDREKL